MRSFPNYVTVGCWANISKPVTQLLELGTSMAESIPVLPAATGRGSQAICNGHPSQGQTPAHGDCATFCGEAGTCSLPGNVLSAMQAQPFCGLGLEGLELWQPCLCWMLSVGQFNKFSTSVSERDFSVYDEERFKNMLKGSYTKF